ncbi:acyltransferase family protein [Sphingomonas bacterium]|uniref:acyltransferase family protein n=1 Tax=Sphingomonas bacterium TaxID=1895847 RepID=UPI001576C1E3|nr:acyltransferase [Sphingomonas bacterium]
MHKGQERIAYLDGLRGLAILLVLAWHYLGPVYAMHLPYGVRYAHLPLVRQGWAGVNLFFLISGYVIFMTLERCSGFVDFLLRRWIRLFPAMLIGSLMIYLAAQLMAAWMPGGRASALDLVPGLTLVNPFYFARYFGINVRSLDGAFWSLYVEAAFYVVIGLLYYRFGWRRALAGLLLLWLSVVVMPPIAHDLHAVPVLKPPFRFLHNLGVGYFGWFASGALFLKARTDRDRGLFAMAIAIGLVASLTTDIPDNIENRTRVALALSVLFFAWAQRSAFAQRLLEARWLLFVGFVSYPLYLVHSAIGVGLIALVAGAFAGLPALVPPLIVTTAMLALAWGMARWAEPAVARLLKPLTEGLRRLLGVRSASGRDGPPLGLPA